MWLSAISTGCSPASAASRSTPPGAVRSTSAATTCRSSDRSSRAPCTTAWGIRAHLGGQILAHRALSKYDDVLALPIVDLEPRRFPPEPIRSVGVAVANRAIHRRDESLDDDRDPNPFVDFVAKRRLGYNLGP